jgi:methionine-gamma-lyase
MMISPARLGADVVVYSMTKYINGASDLVAGAICTTKAMVHQLMDLHTGRVMLLGPTMDPRMAYDIIQRLPHLALRMREHSRRALAICRRLEELGVPVVYPGLESFAQHNLATDLINKGYGYGGMFTIDCGTRERADDLLDELQNKEDFGYIAVSLGYFDTLMSCSGASTSSEISLKTSRKWGFLLDWSVCPSVTRAAWKSGSNRWNGRSGAVVWLRSKNQGSRVMEMTSA